jgi:hypothetical protein
MGSNDRCMFCGDSIPAVISVAGWREVHCTVCQAYRVTEELMEDGPNIGKAGYLVSAWLRWNSLEHKNEVPKLTSERVEEIANEAPRYRPSEKADRLLVALGRISKRPGRIVTLDKRSIVPLAWSRDESEADAYVHWLIDSGLISNVKSGCSLLRAGWDRYEQLMTAGRATSRRAFVAMWFDDTMDHVWLEGIKPAIEQAKFKAYRVKGQAQTDRIDAHIIAEIRACRFVVADVTGSRTAVYYEAGFADGLGKPVIWTCAKSRESEMSFDTRQFPHILWTDVEDLRTQLVGRIRAVIV